MQPHGSRGPRSLHRRHLLRETFCIEDCEPLHFHHEDSDDEGERRSPAPPLLGNLASALQQAHDSQSASVRHTDIHSAHGTCLETVGTVYLQTCFIIKTRPHTHVAILLTLATTNPLSVCGFAHSGQFLSILSHAMRPHVPGFSL